MNEEEILAAARAALAAGEDRDTVLAEVRHATGFQSLDELEAAVSGGEHHSLASDMARMVAQGASYGFGDELVGLAGGDAEASRARVEAIRRAHPWASAGAEAVGSVLTPLALTLAAPLAPGLAPLAEGLVGTTAARAALEASGSRILAGMAGGAAGGLVGGALTGAGESQPGQRAAGAATGGLLGLATGGGLGAAGGTASRFIDESRGAGSIARARLNTALDAAGVRPGDVPERVRALGEGSVVADLGENLGRLTRSAVNASPELAAPGGPKAAIRARAADTGERLAASLRGASGLSSSFDDSLAAAKAGVDEVRDAFFRPLESSLKSVKGPKVRDALRDPRVAAVARRVAPDVASGKRAPRFTELQDVMMDLRDDASAARASGRPNASRKAEAAYDLLRGAMEEDIPNFAEAQRAYRGAIKRVEAHEVGQKLAFRSVREIRATLKGLPDDQARDALRQGLLDTYENALLQKRGGGAMAGRIIDAGSGMQDRLRLLAESDPKFKDLLSGVGREDRWRATWRALSGNSSTAEQLSDSFTLSQLPTDRRAILQRLLLWVGGSEEQRRAAANILGRVLLSDGENAARALAGEIALRASRSAKVGAIGGTNIARQGVARGGLFGP